MRAPCDYCNGWFPKTFSALKVIMVAVVENKSKVKVVGKLMLKTSPLSPTAFLNLSSSKIKVYKIWTPFRSMQIKTSWPNGHHGTKDLVTNSKLACACWWSLGIELRVFLSLSGASNQHTFTPHADRAAEISNQRFFYLHYAIQFVFLWWILCICHSDVYYPWKQNLH